MSTPRAAAETLRIGVTSRADYVSVGFAEQLETELVEMRKAMSQVAENLGNGSFASPSASHEWLTKEVPDEVRHYCHRMRRELEEMTKERDAERVKVAKLRDAIEEAMSDPDMMNTILSKALEATK